MKAERVVLDTNVLIGAALRSQGPPRATVNAVRSENGALLFSDEADCLVTGDHDLLATVPFRRIPIVMPQNFLAHWSGR